MYQSERLEKIMDVLNQYGFVTVKYLIHKLDYSTTTINRDLNVLEQQNLVKRSYGVVELQEANAAPLLFRYGTMEKTKSSIAKKAAEFVNDGETVFIDGSTTTEAMAKHLIHKKDITIVTNNIALSFYLGKHNIHVVTLGGEMVEAPYILGGSVAENIAMQYKADKMFFSSSGVTASGEIHADDEYETLRRIMFANSKQSFYLIDSDKVSENIKKVLFTPKDIDVILSDYHFSEAVKKQYAGTSFIEID